MEKLVSSAVSVKPGTLIANDIAMKKQKTPPKLTEVTRRLSLVISNKSSSWWTTSKWSRRREFSKSLSVLQFHVPNFVTVYLPNQAKPA